MTSFLSILAKSSGAIDQNLAVDKGNNGDVLISTTTGFSFVAANTLTPNLSQVLFVGNTATNNINLNGNVSANTFIGNLTGTATTAVNIQGGAGGSIPYQSAANTTALLANGSNGQYLKSQGSTNPPVWDNFPVISPNLSQVLFVGNTATNDILLNNTGVGTNVISLLPNVGVADPQITLTDGTTTNTINKNGYTTRNSVQNITHYLNFSDSSSTGTGAIQKTSGIECNPSTKTITTTTFIGNLTGLSTTATNIEGGAGGSIPYQSSASTTALLANGTAGQVLTSAGTTLAPTWSTAPQNTDGNWQFDDMWGGQNTNNGPFGMTQVGTPAVNSPQTQSAADGYNGIQRIWNTATNTSVGYESDGYLWFRNMLSNSKGFVMIFRPWPLGTATNTTLYVGFSNDFSSGAPASQLAWQYSTNQAPTGQWSFRQDGANVYSSGYTTTGANQWHRMTLVRTGASTYTTTFQNLDVPSAIYSYSGTCSSTNLNLRMGGLVACISGAASKYLDIDYIGNYFNSAH